MTVVTLFMSDLDPEKRMFKTRKEADEYDKKLALAENLASFVSQHVEGLDEALAESLGLLIAENKDRFMAALKGKPEALFQSVDSDKLTATEKNLPGKKHGDGADAKEKVISIS